MNEKEIATKCIYEYRLNQACYLIIMSSVLMAASYFTSQAFLHGELWIVYIHYFACFSFGVVLFTEASYLYIYPIERVVEELCLPSVSSEAKSAIWTEST